MHRTNHLAVSRALAPIALALAIVLPAPPAFADDVEQAKTLFERGVDDFEAGRFEKACPAIEQSYRLDPRPGTLFALAECEAQRGRIATAVARYTEYLAAHKNFTPKKQAEQKARADTSRAQIAALSPQVPALTLELPPGAPDTLVVKRDGEIVPALSLGTALSVDPGERLVTTQVPGGPLVEQRITLDRSDKKTLRLTVKLEPDPAPPPEPSASVTAPPPATSAPPPPSTVPIVTAPPRAEPPAPSRFPWRAAMFVGVGVGIAGLTTGAVAGGFAIDKKSDVERECTLGANGYFCSQAGVDAGQRLKELGAASTAAIVLGVAGFAAAAIFNFGELASRPGAPRRTVSFAVTPNGASVRGSF